MITGSLASTHDHAKAVLMHHDTPDNTGETPDQEPKRLNNKLKGGSLSLERGHERGIA
jgi:hypothetical protein